MFIILIQDELQNDDSLGEVTGGTTDVLTVALGTEENRGFVRGMGKFVKPHHYFYLPKTVKTIMERENKKLNKRFNKLEGQMEMFNKRLEKGTNNVSEAASNCHLLGEKEDFEDNPDEEVPVSLKSISV